MAILFNRIVIDKPPTIEFYEAFDLTYQCFEFLYKLYYLKKLGINISHRNITGDNITYLSDEHHSHLKIKDIGSICSKINFNDGGSIVIGYHEDETDYKLDSCDKPAYDLIYFVTWCILDGYGKKLFGGIMKYTGINITKLIYDALIDQFPNNSLFLRIGKEEDPRSGKYTIHRFASGYQLQGTVEELFYHVFKTMELVKNTLEEKYNVRLFEFCRDADADADRKTGGYSESYKEFKADYQKLNKFTHP